MVENSDEKIKDGIKGQKMEPQKYIRDPIHDIIKIEDQIVLDIIDSEPMQRLRFIKQLPFASMVYPGADHSRFVHSLGVYHLASKMLDLFEIKDEYDRLVIQLAALLHDIGHGPFSHLFEGVLNDIKYQQQSLRKHEWWTQEIIKKHGGLIKILDSIDKKLKHDICAVISMTYNKKHLSSIVSSQFDADRFDYMLRDSYMTGVKYGRFDLNWLFRNLSFEEIPEIVEDGNKFSMPEKGIVIDGRRGLSALEEYLLGNYYLYKHVYFHKTVLAAEAMLSKILLRAIDCIKKKVDINVKSATLDKIANDKKLDVEDYLKLNDKTIYDWIFTWADKNVDGILYKLSNNLIQRKLFKTVITTGVKGKKHTELIAELQKVIDEFDYTYYVYEGDYDRMAYKNLFVSQSMKKLGQEIYIKDSDSSVISYTGYANKGNNDGKISRTILDLGMEEQFFVVPKEKKYLDIINRIL